MGIKMLGPNCGSDRQQPTEFAKSGIRAKQAAEAVCLLGVERLPLGLQDRLLLDATFTIRSVCQHYSAEKRQEAVSPGDE